MNHSAVAVFLSALAFSTVGCGSPSPEKVCAKMKDWNAMQPDCQAKWTAKQTKNPEGYKKEAACVMDAHAAGDAARCATP